MGVRILVIDNYDSFVYNLVQYLGELGAEPVVFRHDAIDVAGIADRSARRAADLARPGTARGRRRQSLAAHRRPGRRVPVLGVCLGHQCIGQHFGARVVRAPTVMHGKTSDITHDGRGVFAGLPDPLVATRYHSLVVEADTVAARPGGVGVGRRRHRHGPPPPGPAGGGGAVPPRVDPHRRRPAAPGQLAGRLRSAGHDDGGVSAGAVVVVVVVVGAVVVVVGAVVVVVVVGAVN